MAPDLKTFRVLVTPTSFGKGDPALCETLEAAVGSVIYNDHGRPLRSEEVRELLPGCDGYIAGIDCVDRHALDGAKRLKVIARYGVGVDRVDIEAAAEAGIAVTNTPDANSVSVAELTIGLMLALARSIPQLNAAVRNGGWPRSSGATLEGKTIGLIGLGSIGRQVALRLRGWNTRTLCHDPGVDAATAARYGAEPATLDALIAQSDFVSLHVPVLPATRGIVNSDFLAGMKSGAFLVNTARGELVDEAALAAALESGRLGGAALDTFATEPLAPDHPLLRFPGMIVTPHCGAHTDRASANMGWTALRNCLAVLRGEAPENPVLSQGVSTHA